MSNVTVYLSGYEFEYWMKDERCSGTLTRQNDKQIEISVPKRHIFSFSVDENIAKINPKAID
jgi:hypothetical protein